MRLKRALYLTSLALLLFGYQNCSKMDAERSDSSSLNAVIANNCSSILQSAFQATYYPTLQQKCVGCHTQGGTGSGAFADSNLSVAFSAFQSLGRAAVETELVDQNHQPPLTGAVNQSLVTNSQAAWTTADQQYATCQTTGATPTATILSSDVTNAKLTTLETVGASRKGTTVHLSWDLSSSTNGSPTYPLTVGMDVRLAVSLDPTTNKVSAITGYEFLNPAVQLQASATGSYELKGLHVYLNDSLMNYMTTYATLDFVATSMTSTVMVTGASGLWIGTPAATDNFALQFDSISGQGSTSTTSTTSNVPSVVTYAQLTSSDPFLGVFTSNCIGCHNSMNASGGLDLTNYQQAMSAAQMIYIRMENSANPMPPTGVLTSTNLQIVEAWINNGTPQ